MQCGRRFPPWPTGSADGPHLARVVASGEAGVAGPGRVGVRAALVRVVTPGEAGLAGPGWVRGRPALATILPPGLRPGRVGDRSTLAPVFIFGPAPIVIRSVAVPTSCRHGASLSPESCAGPARPPLAGCAPPASGGQGDRRRADQIRVAQRRGRCRGRSRAGGRGRAGPLGGGGCGDDKCFRADMRDVPQQASCGAAGTPAGGHCLRLSCRSVRTACAFPQARGRVPSGIRLGSKAAQHVPLTRPQTYGAQGQRRPPTAKWTHRGEVLVSCAERGK
jgi:hypothetical protein